MDADGGDIDQRDRRGWTLMTSILIRGVTDVDGR